MTEKTGKSQITFIGTGAMGKPMVEKTLKNGYPVKVNDKYKKAAEPLVAAGAIGLTHPKNRQLAVMSYLPAYPCPNMFLKIWHRGLTAHWKECTPVPSGSTRQRRTIIIPFVSPRKQKRKVCSALNRRSAICRTWVLILATRVSTSAAIKKHMIG